MIVRVLGEGQWRVGKKVLAGLNEFDQRIVQAVGDSDQAALSEALVDLVERITCYGEPIDDTEICQSELILPDPSSTLAEVKALLDESEHDGLVPG